MKLPLLVIALVASVTTFTGVNFEDRDPSGT